MEKPNKVSHLDQKDNLVDLSKQAELLNLQVKKENKLKQIFIHHLNDLQSCSLLLCPDCFINRTQMNTLDVGEGLVQKAVEVMHGHLHCW